MHSHVLYVKYKVNVDEVNVDAFVSNVTYSQINEFIILNLDIIMIFVKHLIDTLLFITYKSTNTY